MDDILAAVCRTFEEKFGSTVGKDKAMEIFKILSNLGGALKLDDIKSFAKREEEAGRNVGHKPGAGEGRQMKAITTANGNRAKQVAAVAVYLGFYVEGLATLLY